MTTNTNKELIQSAYSTALHPDQLSIFEDHWARFLARQSSAVDDEATKQEIQEHLSNNLPRILQTGMLARAQSLMRQDRLLPLMTTQ